MEQGSPRTRSWQSSPTCMLSLLRRLLRQHKQCEPCFPPGGRVGLRQGRQSEGRACRGGPAAPLGAGAPSSWCTRLMSPSPAVE